MIDESAGSEVHNLVLGWFLRSGLRRFGLWCVCKFFDGTGVGDTSNSRGLRPCRVGIRIRDDGNRRRLVHPVLLLHLIRLLHLAHRNRNVSTHLSNSCERNESGGAGDGAGSDSARKSSISERA